MELNIVPIITLLCVGIVGSYAALTPELYWKEAFPNEAIPKAIRDSLPNHGMKSGYVGVKEGGSPFGYGYGPSQAQLHDDPTRAFFFLENDMKLGHKMSIDFTQTTNDAKFLPRAVAQSIPFSSDKIQEILNEFSVQRGSEEAQLIEETIKGCERKGIEGEEKYCATSLNDMANFARSTLRKNVKALSTKAQNNDNKGHEYTIRGVQKVAKDGDVAVCHKQNYPFAVFYCHQSTRTSPYDVSLTSENGMKVKAVAVCHKDTSGWNPKHLAFQVLNVKPGSVPICHFLPEDHIVWVRN